MRSSVLWGCGALLAVFSTGSKAGEAISAEARSLHERTLVLDTHLDTPARFSSPHWDIAREHDYGDTGSQVDYPRMVAGGLDGGFWVVYTGQGARDEAGNRKARDAGLKRLFEIREMLAAHPDKFELATSAEDAQRIKDAGKRSVYISLENAYPLSADPSLLATYYSLGLRMMGITHTGNNDFGDSSNDKREWGGLSPAGRELVREANRLGILIDQSHASDEVLDQLLELSKAPIILSHSAADGVHENPRNVDDARLRKLAGKGGVIHVNSLGYYLIPFVRSPEYSAALGKLQAEYGDGDDLTPEQTKRMRARRAQINAEFGIVQASFEDYMKHVLHILKVVGPNHVGIGADWDGGGGVVGMEDISLLPKITQRLLDEGYTPQDIENIWSGNLLRILRQAQALADREYMQRIGLAPSPATPSG